jgi:hypothetical protein
MTRSRVEVAACQGQEATVGAERESEHILFLLAHPRLSDRITSGDAPVDKKAASRPVRQTKILFFLDAPIL